MINQQQRETRTPNQGAAPKAGQDSQQKRNAHTNSAAAGKDSDEAADIRGQHGDRHDEPSRLGK
jgi:hypothetical protein